MLPGRDSLADGLPPGQQTGARECLGLLSNSGGAAFGVCAEQLLSDCAAERPTHQCQYNVSFGMVEAARYELIPGNQQVPAIVLDLNVSVNRFCAAVADITDNGLARHHNHAACIWERRLGLLRMLYSPDQ